MNKKFFFFDIDGTLAVGTPGRQYIPESTKKAIRVLKEKATYVTTPCDQDGIYNACVYFG